MTEEMPMANGAVRISLKDLERAVDHLPQAEKLRFVQRLESQTWGTRINRLLARIDARVKRRPITEQQITALVEQVRQELYAQRGR